MKQKINQLISVLTPIWNRRKYIDRVWQSLENQTYKNFEWVVADDGSTDGTLERIEEIKKIAKFPIVIISANTHIGKTRMDNEAIKIAQGSFIIWNDSDDYYIPTAFEKLIQKWNEINDNEKSFYYGITAYCKSIENNEISIIREDIVLDQTLNDLRYLYNVRGDLVHFTKSELLKEYEFPEVDQLIPEGVFWTKIGNLKTKLIKESLLIKEYKADNCISFNNKMKYNRGMAYSKAIISNNLKNYPNSRKEKAKELINFLRFSIHGEISIKQIMKLWGNNSKKYAVLCSIPIALILAIIDMAKGKVVKTHREYNFSLKNLIITISK
jgi:glycosyltransferase involved in cell wall biosynthesis